jgi:hypothetical protein
MSQEHSSQSLSKGFDPRLIKALGLSQQRVTALDIGLKNGGMAEVTVTTTRLIKAEELKALIDAVDLVDIKDAEHSSQ